MKILIRTLSLILLLSLCFHGCKGSKAALVSKQSYYKYSAENFGYSNIIRIYSSDSVDAKKSFFNSESLQHLEITVHSEIKKTILKTTQDGVLICYQLQNPILDIKRDGASINLDVITQDLKKPVFVQTDISGKIGGLKFDSETSEIAKGLYRDIIGRMQFVKPKKNIKDWQTTEENTLGTYIAEYHLTNSDSSGEDYIKKIVGYTAYKSQNENQKTEIDNSTIIRADMTGTIKKINTSEAQIVFRENDTLSVLGSKISVVMTSEEIVDNNDVYSLSELEKSSKYSQKTTLSEALSEEKIRKMSYKGTLGSDNWETLIKNLSKAEYQTKEAKKGLILKFRALFYLRPEYCKLAVSLLENELATSNVFIVLSKALSITETPDSTDALAMIIEKNKNDEDLLGRLIPVLTTTKYPTDMAIEVIKPIAFSTDVPQNYFTASTAQLALGGMANRLRQTDTLKSNMLTHYLMEKIKTEKDTIQHLLVLGNTGSPMVFPFIKSLVEHSHTSDQVKIEAISALSLIDYKPVSVYLKKLLQHKNVAIQNKATEVLDFQKNNFE